MLLQPKNWGVFQHYKDRSPPWIKLHRDILLNREYMRLPIASKALAPLLWLLASEKQDGIFDGSYDELQFRLHITQKEYEEGIKPLINKGFFVVASGALADCLQDAIPETETETETEGETEREADAKRSLNKRSTPVERPLDTCSTTVKLTPKKPKVVVTTAPDGVSDEVWESFLAIRKAKNSPVTTVALDVIRKEAVKAGISLQDALITSCARGWQGFKASWAADKQTATEERRNQMAELTRGLSVPKPKPFWAKTESTEVIPNVEPKRLL